MRKIELPNCRDEKVGVDGIEVLEFTVFLAQYVDLHLPLELIIIPARFIDCGVESDMLVETPFLCNADEVCL